MEADRIFSMSQFAFDTESRIFTLADDFSPQYDGARLTAQLCVRLSVATLVVVGS